MLLLFISVWQTLHKTSLILINKSETKYLHQSGNSFRWFVLTLSSILLHGGSSTQEPLLPNLLQDIKIFLDLSSLLQNLEFNKNKSLILFWFNKNKSLIILLNTKKKTFLLADIGIKGPILLLLPSSVFRPLIWWLLTRNAALSIAKFSK